MSLCSQTAMPCCWVEENGKHLTTENYGNPHQIVGQQGMRGGKAPLTDHLALLETSSTREILPIRVSPNPMLGKRFLSELCTAEGFKMCVLVFKILSCFLQLHQ